MSSIDLYTQYSLEMDPSSKAISLTPNTTTGKTTTEVTNELQALNSLHRSIVALGAPSIPPPPLPVNPKRSAQIAKLRDSANTAYRKSNYPEAVRLYTYAIEMALTRPGWEPVALAREELASLYANRAQAHMAQQAWPEGLVDAKSSIGCKGAGNVKAYWRSGKCLLEMGRLDEAKEILKRGLEVEGKAGEGRELTALLGDVEESLRK